MENSPSLPSVWLTWIPVCSVGEKPFSCLHCSRAFADRSNLRAHLQTHSEVKKYQCASCFKTFSRISLLAKHQEAGCPLSWKPLNFYTALKYTSVESYHWLNISSVAAVWCWTVFKDTWCVDHKIWWLSSWTNAVSLDLFLIWWQPEEAWQNVVLTSVTSCSKPFAYVYKQTNKTCFNKSLFCIDWHHNLLSINGTSTDVYWWSFCSYCLVFKQWY